MDIARHINDTHELADLTTDTAARAHRDVFPLTATPAAVGAGVAAGGALAGAAAGGAGFGQAID